MARSGKPAGQRKPACRQIKRQIENRVGKACAGDLEIRLKPRWLRACIKGAAPFHLAACKRGVKAIKPKLTILQHQSACGILHRRQAQHRDTRGAQREIAIQPCQQRDGQRFLIRQIGPGQCHILCRKSKHQAGPRR